MNPYVSRPVRVAYVQVIGKIWQPGVGTCAYQYDISDHDLTHIEEFTRDNVEEWLSAHAGDFQSIIDFHAVCGKEEIGWAKEDSELTFNDCMYGYED